MIVQYLKHKIYFVFREHEPKQTDTPIYVTQETKTDDKESRNIGQQITNYQ